MSDDHPIASVELTVALLVKLLAAVALVLSLGQLLTNTIAFVAIGLLVPEGELERSLSTIPDSGTRAFGIGPWIFRYLREYVAISTALALANVGASMGLLARRRWARNYFVLWACCIAAAAALVIHLLYVQNFAAAPPLPSDAAALAATMAERAMSLLADGTAVLPVLVILASLCVIALLSSEGAVAPPEFPSRRPLLDPARAPGKSAVAFAVVGLRVPWCGLVGLVLGFVVWIAAQNDERSSRRKAAVVAMLLGAFGCARDVYTLYTMTAST